VILVIAALRASATVTMPLAFAAFLIVLAWPLKRWLERYLPRGWSSAAALLALLAIFTVFVGALALSLGAVASRAPQYADQLQQIYQSAVSWAEQRGIPVPSLGEGGDRSGGGSAGEGGGSGGVTGLLGTAAREVLADLGLLVLVMSFLLLGLLEVRDFHAKLRAAFRGRGDELLRTLGAITAKYERYILTETLACAITATLTGLFAFAIGLDFAFLWAVLAFLLNYIPTLGSVAAVVPPTLFAAVQFGGFGMPLLVLGGLALIELAVGNYVTPRLQGRALSLSPLVVLLSITFWGWVWGIPGALLGVPLTVGLVIACQHFEATRWIAVLLADVEEGERIATGQEREGERGPAE
jgi:AI-2 transport protein TqsA